MRRCFKIAAWTLGLLAATTAVLAWVLYRGTQHVPEFYEQALAPTVPPAVQQQLGDDFERETLELHNQATHVGRWEATFTDDEINAWLTTQLPVDHPRALPAEVREPRILIEPERVQVAFQYAGEPLPTVVSLAADVYLTDKPNQIAVRIRSIRAGWVPLPLKLLVDQVTEGARRGGLDLVWSQTDGDPVALIPIPARLDRPAPRDLHLDTLDLQPGAVRLSGQTSKPEAKQ